MPDSAPPATPGYRPLLPQEIDQGDPYILSVPESAGARFRYYVYTTGEGPVGGLAFPVYASDDLTSWRRLHDALLTDREGHHWAPCVTYLPGLARPYVMLYSSAIAIGAFGDVGHVLRRADAQRPEGPFIESEHVLTPDLDFAIDADVYRLRDGSLKIAFATNFVDREPYGTGIVEADIADDLTAIRSEPRILARPEFDWHVYNPALVLPWMRIPGVDWTRQTVRWHTVEAPVGGLVSPRGRPVYLYSGGCYFDFYAIGAVIEEESGLRDVSDSERTFVAGPNPQTGLYAPGHCSYLRLGDEEYLMLHARFGSLSAKRQMCLARLRWTAEGRPYAEPA